MQVQRKNFFAHNWKKVQSKFSVELRKKKRVENINKKRLAGEEFKGSEEDDKENSEVFKYLNGISMGTEDEVKIVCMKLMNRHENLGKIDKKNVFYGVVQVLDKYSLETTGMLLELLGVLKTGQLKFIEEILESGLFMLNIQFLYKLSFLGYNDFLLSPRPLKVIFDQAASTGSPCQLDSLAIIKNLLCSSEENLDFLMDIGILDLFYALIELSSASQLKLVLLSLSTLISLRPIQVSQFLNKLIPSIFSHLPSKYLSLSPELDSFLLSSIHSCQTHSLFPAFLSSLNLNFYSTLQEILIQHYKNLTPELLSFLSHLLTPCLPIDHLENFTNTGCYNALEYCIIACPDHISSIIQQIFSDNFA